MFDKFATDEDLELARAISRALSGELPADRLSQPDGGISRERAFWPTLLELGFLGVNLPETIGGSEAGALVETAMFRAFGTFLLTPKPLATVIGTALAVAAGDEALAHEILSGQKTIALGQARTDDPVLIDADGADLAVLCGPAGLELATCANGASSPVDWSIDDSLAIVRRARGKILASAPMNGDIHLRFLRLAAAMLVGNAEGTTALAVAHARERHQFGKPIGAFQAVKHMCADMSVRANAAGAQLAQALPPDDDTPHDPTEVNAAVLLAGSAARENGASAIQVFGGMGFTAECPAQRYLKRAVLLELLAGGRQALGRGVLSDILDEGGQQS